MALSTPPASSRPDDFERQLFDSARHDTVPEGSRRNVARALGIASGAPPGEVSGKPRVERTGGPAGTPGASGPAQASLELSLFGKAALVAIAGGAVALGVALLQAKASVHSLATPAPIAASGSVPPAPAAVRRDIAPEVRASSPKGSLPEAAFVREPERPRREPAPRRAPPKRVAPLAGSSVSGAEGSPPAADAKTSRLLYEVRQLDTARNALSAGDPSRALREIERYEREFPDGTLALDAALLEVRALDRSGQRAAAHRQARGLLSRPGAERHRAELEAIINPLASGSQPRRRDIEEAR